MAYFTAELCRRKLDEYLDAESKVLNSQSYSIGGRSLTRANLSEIRAGIDIWSRRLAQAENGNCVKVMNIVPVDRGPICGG